MSQRLLISSKKDITNDDVEQMDAIYSEESSLETLLKWISYFRGSYSGPFKLIIRDYTLLHCFDHDLNVLIKIVPQIRGYEDFWGVYYDKQSLEYPTRREVFDMVKDEMHRRWVEIEKAITKHGMNK
jgi:hypothetical protein